MDAGKLDPVVHALRCLCCIRVWRSALHEGKAKTEPAAPVGALVSQPGRLQYRRSVQDWTVHAAHPHNQRLQTVVDTVFIVLRKQPLIFLHWYHHITVLLYTWYTYKGQVAGCSWFMTMNFLVHSIMYSYFAARAAGVRVPRPFAMIITAFQILQMVIGLLIQGLVFLWLHEEDCPSQVDNIFWGSLMYFSYLVLFASFFYNSYLRGSSGDKRTKAD
ncbi:very long chain fatty acid elongase 6-like isoform X2 [Channa argus]|uniref:very long chain fatty acid elongase 6-like isoform X2 n=1 Tax=Channa argus TaxID=215402 RepID=UPI00352261B4